MNRAAVSGLLSGALLASSACQPASAPQNPAPPSDSTAPASAAATQAPTLRYHCDGLDFTVRYQGELVRLQTPEQTYSLPRVRAADGAKFERDHSTLWSKGGDALVTRDGKPYTNCLEQIGRAHVWTPVTTAHLVCRLLLEKKN